jgi:hypothetical protein
MMNRSITLVFSILFFAGVMVPAFAQSSDNVVINEVDINPPGDDSASISEWIELYNPTDSDIDIGGWEIASTTILKKTMSIPYGTVIKSEQFMTYSYDTVWFTDVNESVELRDANQIIVDKTPIFSDLQNDFTSWQRLFDGYDLDSSDDWKFVTSTAGSSNGKLIETQYSEGVNVTVSSEQPSYLFGDVAVISGNISEEVYVVKPYFQPEQIVISITGPNFDKTITMYPDLDLNYETTLSLHQVLGIDEGNYDVSVSYAGATDNTNFSVGYEIIEQEIKPDEEFYVITDKPQYIPGQTVQITGFATDIIPFEGMKFTVTDSSGELISNGNLYPTNGEFKTSVFLTTVNPSYGDYEIVAEYFDKSSLTSFEVVEDFKEDVAVSLWADKEAYGLNDKVTISGRLNHVFVSTLDLEIIQTKQSSIGSSSAGSDAGFKILDGVTIKGDGSFNYSFTIPDHDNRLGAYKITVSKDVGSATIVIPVVEDPDNFIASDEPLTVVTDKGVYEFGESINIRGFVQDPYANSSYSTGAGVKVTIAHEDGRALEIMTQGKNKNLSTDAVVTGYTFSAIPELSGLYSIDVDVTQNIFTAGNYVAKSQYGALTETATFSIIDSLVLEDGALVTIDKEIYGLGETVHLSGIIPPTGDNSVSISVTRPDGTRTDSGTSVDNQRFSWDWNVPVYEKPQTLKDDDGRDVRTSNYGIYKIRVAVASESTDIFFKVSADPENDTLSTNPLFVSTDKSLYKAGEKLKVIGNVIKRVQGDEGLVVTERIQLRIIDGIYKTKVIHESNVYPNQGGEFSSTFELPPTIFDEGEYIVRANYLSTQTESRFSVANDFVFGGDADLALLLDVDKSEYFPGDTVVVSGKPTKLIYIEKFDVSVIALTENEITCGSFICGVNSVAATTIRPSPFGSFTHEFVIPDNVSSIGSYQVDVDAEFDTATITFDVIEKPYTSKLNTVIEKENRISEKVIPIFTEEKTTDDITIAPRVLSGSLVTPIRGDESNVNIKVSTVTGTCIIGQDANCLVRESTRKQGQIYDVVDVDGISLNVRYSGPDVRLEKFSILPESSIEFLPDANWNVEVIKDDQVSRFYYKVTYKTLE